MNLPYSSHNHSKHLILLHVIFVCKYRKTLFDNINIGNYTKILSNEICTKHNITIHTMEVDRNHIHYMLEILATHCIANEIKTMKSYITFHIWLKFSSYLSKFFWKERTFFTDGYFVSSIGNVSQNTLKHYIDNQG